MKNTYGVGVMGAGMIAGQYLTYAPLFAGFEVRGVADILPDRSASRSAEFGVKNMTRDEMLKSDEIDVIISLTPPAVHYDVMMEAIAAGKHAYTEKPFALSLEQGKALKQAADAKGLRVGAAPDTFLGGAHQQARSIVDSGAIGRITSGTAFVMSRGMEHWHLNPDFFFQVGGGPVLDVGPYYVTNLIQFIGPVKRVTAFSGSARAEREITAPDSPLKGQMIKVGTPTTIHGVLEFHSGAIVSLVTSWDVVSHGHSPIELYGSKGTLYVPDPNFFGGDIVMTDAAGAKSPVTAWEHPLGLPNAGSPNAARANYRSAGVADFVASIDEGRPARCGVDLVLHAVDVMTSLLRAGETGEVQTLATTCERPAALGPDEARALLRS